MRLPKVDSASCVSIQSYSKEDREDVGYVHIAYGKVIRSPDMTSEKSFNMYGRLVRV